VKSPVSATKSYNLVDQAYSHRRIAEKLQSSEARGANSVAISVSTYVIALSGTGWKSVGGQLLASGVLLLSGCQDMGLRAWVGAAFGFFMAIAFGISALATAIQANLQWAAAICVVVLCCEIWLIVRWHRRRTSAENRAS
jgi:hypothetical protein